MVKMKVKQLLRFMKHRNMETWGSGGIAPSIPNLGIRKRWAVKSMLRPLYPRGSKHLYILDRRLG
jgi:hypothetical protein